MNVQHSPSTDAIEARPWVIVLIQPNAQRSDLVRFRNRFDGEDHLRKLRRFIPKTQFELVFDSPAQSPLDSLGEVSR
ncbi:hypothetical protein C7B61_13105 [filamentous cyanobacterium CCP1]|nr:hypothetical protein C7B61_13105 [filamentous cyanobacterium CCP1]